MTEREKTIELVEKLMRRTRENAHATEAEIEQAVALARQLMRKHQIEMAEILAREEETLKQEDIVEQEARTSSKLFRFEKGLATCVAKVCGVRWFYQPSQYITKGGNFRTRYTIKFYGLRVDTEAARILFCEMLIVVRALARGRVGTNSTAVETYCEGFASGLLKKINDQMRKEEPVDNKTKTLIDTTGMLMEAHEKRIGLKTAKSRDLRSDKARSFAFSAGWQDGQDYELNSEKKERLPENTPKLN